MKLSRRNMFIAGGIATVPLAATGVGLAGANTLSGLPVTGTVPDELAVFDSVMKTYIDEREISGAQLAVARNGKLLLARGYGTDVEPDSLCRIASLSKHITSAAILTLVQDGKLALDAPVTKLLGLSDEADSRLSKATVLRMMQHLGGWDRDASLDQLWSDHDIAKALGTSLPLSHTDIIEYATARKLDVDPGTKMAYSNYGYMLLGRIIEKVSGETYEDYVKAHVLDPVGISRMRLGESLKEDAADTEISYDSTYEYKTVLDDSGTLVPKQYGGFSMANQDANGGWLASAVDLLRLGSIFDEPGEVLNEESLKTVVAKPETGENDDGWWYGAGWRVRKSGDGLNRWHGGSMPGTFAHLVTYSGGVSICAIVNRRQEDDAPEFGSIDSLLVGAYNDVETWPSEDLFGEYF